MESQKCARGRPVLLSSTFLGQLSRWLLSPSCKHADSLPRMGNAASVQVHVLACCDRGVILPQHNITFWLSLPRDRTHGHPCQMFKYPCCMQVDAALDLSHTQNIGRMIKTHFPYSQFIVVSLKEGMFSNANVLFRTKFVDGVSTVTRTANGRKCVHLPMTHPTLTSYS